MTEPPSSGAETTDQAEPDPTEVMANRRFAVLLVFVAIVGVITSVVAWCFLEAVHQIQTGVFTDLPKDLGYDHGAPNWWYLVVLAIAGLITAAAITRLPGNGGHTPANGLSTERLGPEAMPGVILAALASIGLGAVIGPEAPLIAIGGGLGVLAARRLQKDPPQQIIDIVAASATFAAVSFLLGSPLIASIILIEAIGLGGSQLRIVLVPGLMAAGIGSLVSQSEWAPGPGLAPATSRSGSCRCQSSRVRTSPISSGRSRSRSRSRFWSSRSSPSPIPSLV